VDLAYGHWLWLLPLAWVWTLWLTLTSHTGTAPVRRWVSGGLRLLIAMLLILAIAGLRWLRPVDEMNVFFLLDRSESVPGAEQEAAREWLHRTAQEKPDGDRAGLILFGREAGIEAGAGRRPDFSLLRTAVGTDRTDIGAAIRLATAALPETGQRRLVLISDGRENLGDAAAAAAAAAGSDVSIDVVPMGVARGRDASIERVQVPSEVRRGQAFEVRVLVVSDEPGPATLQVHRNDEYLGEREVLLDAGKNLFAFPQTVAEAGFFTYDIRLEAAGDRVPQNNRGVGFTWVRGPPRVLVVTDDAESDQTLVEALVTADIVVRPTASHRFPETLAELHSYDAVVLCDLSTADLPWQALTLLERAVREFGVGLVCVGGDRSYGAGGYGGTPLERILPVDMDPSSRKVLPSIALMLVIDASGSMSGEPIEMARQAAMAAVQELSDRDYVGVLAFDGAPYLVADLQSAANRRDIIQSIAAIRPGGGTVMYPALDRARELLESAQTATRHCVVLTDGASAPDDFEALAQTMAGKRITVSTVGLGPSVDLALLQTIAAIGQGRFYRVLRPREIPRVFLQETALILRSAIVEEPFQPQPVLLSELVRGITRGEFPPLLGYVATEPKARAEVPLVTHLGDPLLAHWQYGLGRTVAFTSDARSRWAMHWVGWERYSQFWRQVISWSLRRMDSEDLVAEVVIEQDLAQLNVMALDDKGYYRNFLELAATLSGPDGATLSLPLRQSGPGQYQAAFPAHVPGLYLFNLVHTEHGEPRSRQVLGATLSTLPEFRHRHPNLQLLHQIATTTGGRILDPQGMAANPFFRDRVRSLHPVDLWPWLLKAVVVLFALDVAVRRLNPDPDQMQHLWNCLQRCTPGWRATAAPPEAAESITSLLARRNRLRASPLRQDYAGQWDAFEPKPPRPAPDTPTSLPVSPLRDSDSPARGPVAESSERTSITQRLLDAKRRSRSRF
jgi:Ca-activated chloride channel homolog